MVRSAVTGADSVTGANFSIFVLIRPKFKSPIFYAWGERCTQLANNPYLYVTVNPQLLNFDNKGTFV